MVRCCYLVVGVCLALVSAAAADEQKKDVRRDPSRFFEQFDKNKDGFIDRSEAPERLKDRVDQLDKNGDGKLSKEELGRVLARFGAAQPAGAAGDPLFKLLDANGDGKLSKEELQNAPKLLERLDKNKDGFLDREETVPAPPARRRQRSQTSLRPAAIQDETIETQRPPKE